MRMPCDAVFGPVPSRRLGASLGVNNLVGKTCTYACVYCQAGPTCHLTIERAAHVAPSIVEAAACERLRLAEAASERIDYVTIVPSGEPTLDLGLGELIDRLGWCAPPTAVITNGSLLWREDVRADLAGADWVSVKVDAAREATWRCLNRPHGRLSFDRVLDGILRFRERFRGTFVTETMLVSGVNDVEDELEAMAALLGAMAPSAAYVSAPIRPPAERWVRAPGRDEVAEAARALGRCVPDVRLLIEDEEETCGAGEDAEQALLSTAAVHPLRAGAIDDLLRRTHSGWPVVDRLVRDGRLERVTHRGQVFYRARPRRARAGHRREGSDRP
jgi:wyosine [tRNA(Phe)-imidazoG37] synthetase (radical SAM superfamily)